MSAKGFKAGDKAPYTGIYLCEVDEKKSFRLNITEGSEFPECTTCGEKKTLWVPEVKNGN